MRPVASTGPGAFLRVIHVDGADDEYGHGTAGTAVRTRRPAIARDLRRNPAFAAWRRVFATHHFASAIAVPLLVGGEVYGVLLVYAADPDAFDGTEVGLLEELGPDISHGIAALRAQHERAQAMAELERARSEREARLEERTRELSDRNRQLTASRESVRKAVELQPAAILLDIHLPEIVGYDVARELRRHPPLARARALGCARSIQKPYVGHELLSCVKAAIGGG